VKSPPELVARFRAEGRKITPQRQRIFEVLDHNTEHLTAEAIWAQVRTEMPSISLKTVYQTLHDLTELGEIHALHLGTGSARFDPNLDAHHHLVCAGCGEVHDLYADFTEVRVPRGADHDFEISSTEIVFRGRCPACAAPAGGSPTAR
jgi:Fe2+ or Zn2+ uptake regulation protein